MSLDNSLSAIVHVLGVQVDWYRLGVQLKVPSQQLEVFRCHDPHLRIEEVLNFGLRSEERSPTGQILTDALKKMGHDSLAQRIHNLFAGSPAGPVSGLSPVTTTEPLRPARPANIPGLQSRAAISSGQRQTRSSHHSPIVQHSNRQMVRSPCVSTVCRRSSSGPLSPPASCSVSSTHSTTPLNSPGTQHGRNHSSPSSASSLSPQIELLRLSSEYQAACRKIGHLEKENNELKLSQLRSGQYIVQLEKKLREARSVLPVQPGRVDVGVQFNYLVPMSRHLRGVHVADEKLFTINGEPQWIEWEEYGIKIEIPQNVTAGPCDIAIKAIVAGQFDFPEGTELVSAVYAISTSRRLAKPLALQIQHCVAIAQNDQTKHLSFVRAQCNQPTLPYHFKPLAGGVFSSQSYYGRISCDHFSCLAIVVKVPAHVFQEEDNLPPLLADYAINYGEKIPVEIRSLSDSAISDVSSPFSPSGSLSPSISIKSTELQMEDQQEDEQYPVMEYYAQIYYIPRERNSWGMKFNVTKSLNAFISFVKQEHSNWEESDCFQFAFSGKKLLLDIKRKDTVDGWTVLSTSYPCKIYKQSVDACSEAPPPSCLVEIVAKETSDTAPYLHYPVTIVGIFPERTLFIYRKLQLDTSSLQSPIQAQTSPPQHSAVSTVKTRSLVLSSVLIEIRECTDWFYLGACLGLEYSTLENIRQANAGDPTRCKVAMIAQWLQGKDGVIDLGGPSWQQLADTLNLAGYAQLGLKITSTHCAAP